MRSPPVPTQPIDTIPLANAALDFLALMNPINELTSEKKQGVTQCIKILFDTTELQRLYYRKSFKKERCALINNAVIDPYKSGRLIGNDLTKHRDNVIDKVRNMLHTRYASNLPYYASHNEEAVKNAVTLHHTQIVLSEALTTAKKIITAPANGTKQEARNKAEKLCSAWNECVQNLTFVDDDTRRWLSRCDVPLMA